MAEHDDIISQFTSMTGCDTERAKFYLESHNWEIGTALETYFDTSAGGADFNMDVDKHDLHPVGPALPQHGHLPGQAPYPQVSAQRPPPSGLSAAIGKVGSPVQPVNPPSSSARVATLSSIRKYGDLSEDDSDDERDPDDQQEFYVGSGQEVLGPGKKRNPDDIITSVFKSARARGAEQVEEPEHAVRAGQPRSFTGSGIRLGDTNSAAAGPASVPVRPSARDASAGGTHNPIVTLRMWRNGFSVDAGQLRLYDDPANQQFMDSIRQGRVPPELIVAARGREIKLQMEDKRDQEYAPPKRQAEFFGGTGHMLGSPAPAVISKPASSTPQALPSDDAKKAAEDKAKSAMAVDSAQPATNIQIRLPDGSRLVNRFNEVHTVADIRRFIQLARPEFAAQDFQMLAGFPLKPLADEKASLKEANLLNAAINVK